MEQHHTICDTRRDALETMSRLIIDGGAAATPDPDGGWRVTHLPDLMESAVRENDETFPHRRIDPEAWTTLTLADDQERAPMPDLERLAPVARFLDGATDTLVLAGANPQRVDGDGEPVDIDYTRLTVCADTSLPR